MILTADRPGNNRSSARGLAHVVLNTLETRGTAAKRFRPTLEALEDRSLLSVVVTTEDSAAACYSWVPWRFAIFAANATPGPGAITFAINPDDPGHFYYKDDGFASQVSLDHVAVTTAANDADLAGIIDPDWPASAGGGSVHRDRDKRLRSR